MGRITDITKQKRNKTRVNIFIDGEFVCGLDEVAAAAARIKIGDEISADEFKALVKKSELNSAFERAVSYLSLTPRARKEIERYLSDKGYEREVIQETLIKLDSYHYIDDYGYAQSYIKSKSKKYGSFRLAAELRKKGIAQDLIDELLNDGGDDNALSVAQKYLNSHKSADKQKLKRFLAGRGFSWDSISSVVSKLNDLGAFDNDFDGEAFDDE
ncbi:MAG: RecX family transcriptional regulator [Clostridiales bacterium]|nr:RecX family transcriptional regulator [Clostridiales bacterium]